MVTRETVTTVYKYDVRPGSKYEDNIHHGNKHYKNLLQTIRPKYHKLKDDRASRGKKIEYAQRVYTSATQVINGRRGRFLAQKRNVYGIVSSSQSHRYQVMTKEEAMAKITRDLTKKGTSSQPITMTRARSPYRSRSGGSMERDEDHHGHHHHRRHDNHHNHHKNHHYHDDDDDDHASKATSRQDMSRLVKEITEQVIDKDVKIEMKFAKGKIYIKRKKEQHKTVQSRTAEIEQMMNDQQLTEQERTQWKKILKGFQKNTQQIGQEVKEREQIEQVIHEQQAIDPTERVLLAAQRELTTRNNLLTPSRKANLRAVIQKLSVKDPLMMGTVQREWQANPSTRWISTRALDNTMTVCCPSNASLRGGSALMQRMPSITEDNDNDNP